ncbi:MAG: 1-(5-phosphoribosyl)-5-[(5-phosphoribosylamino)methylideneamino]imidazole-4-carboxamide isomerase [Candidatus Promineofilum sp.]|nr:1-(5-phosphoribosyl)-5-[(5-phosphoribosylamino)methylideneamino]imidazole-4-carboxamide isomerase [Promineifilum sp.]
MDFTIYPAIDLRQGRVVRLQLGDPDRQTIFGDDPVAVAGRWLDAGARWIHVVNLDGAFAEEASANWAALERLGKLPVRLQFGGGIRATAEVDRALACGVSRVVLGTAALERPALVAESIERFGGECVAVGIDAREGRVRTRGWKHETAVTPSDLAGEMGHLGVRTIIYTDISRDGVLSGVNVATTVALAEASGLEVIASGGVNSLADVGAIVKEAASGIGGVIIGRALYEGQVKLAAALELAARG